MAINRSRCAAARRFLPVLLLCTTVATPVFAQTEPNPAGPLEIKASLSHSIWKSATQKIGSTLATAGIFYFGTGNLTDMTVLTTVGSAGAMALYAGNEYLWDYFSPASNTQTSTEHFDTAASARRNGWKFLTFKPAITLYGMGTIYWWTGSFSAMAIMGPASMVVYPAVFFVNNMGWDWYDWYEATTQKAATTAKP